MREAVHISRAENKAAAKLKRVLAELVLVVTCGARTFAADGIVLAKKMEQVRRAEARGLIGLALVVNQERELDSRFLTKHPSVVGVAQADDSQRSTFVPEGLLVFAQLRDVFTAKNSSIVAEKDEHGGATGPQRPKPNFLAIRVGKHDFREPAT